MCISGVTFPTRNFARDTSLNSFLLSVGTPFSLQIDRKNSDILFLKQNDRIKFITNIIPKKRYTMSHYTKKLPILNNFIMLTAIMY